MTISVVQPHTFPWFDYSRYSFSLGVAAGGGVYLSGHTASEFDSQAKRMVVNGGMADQVRTAYAKIAAILEGAGRSYTDVVRIVEYVRPEGMEHYPETIAVREEIFGTHHPCVNTVPVRALLRPDAFIEIEVTAGPTGATHDLGSGLGTAVESNGLIFLPTVQATDEGGQIIGAGDVVAQTEAIFAKAEKMLAALDLGMGNVVKTVDYLTPAALASYRNTGQVRRKFLGPVYPVAAGILMPRMLHPNAMIQYDFIATRGDVEGVNPGWDRYKKLTYSPGVRTGNYLFLSGQGSLNPETQKIEYEGDVVAQAGYTYENIIKVIEAAGGSAANLVKTIEYVTPPALPRYRDVASVRTQLMHKPYPASTGLICEALLRPEMEIEVDPFAILD